MHRILRAGLLLACLLLAGCLQQPATTGEWTTLDAIADSYMQALLQREPERATYLALQGARHDRLFDNRPEALARWQASEDRWLAALRSRPAPAEIGSRDWVTYGVLRERLEASVQTRICRKPLWETSTTTGWYTALPFVFDQQPLETAELRAQAIQRLESVEGFIDQEISNLRRGLKLGFSSPKVTVAQVPEQVRALQAPDSPFLGIAGRAADPAFKASVEAVFAQRLVPALERFAVFIEQDYLPAARESLAITAHPDGAQCYAAVVRAYATVAPDTDAIHALGLVQIKALRAEMKQLLDDHFDGEPIERFLRRVNTDPAFTFATEAAVLAYSQSALAAAQDAMPRAFERLPAATVSIKPYPAYAASGVGEYQAPSEDGSRPGIFYIAVRDPTSRSRATQQSTLYHETYPGHHLQGALALELGAQVHPVVRYLWNSGYGEGWALYAERVAQELGLYSGPLDTLGLLSDQAARAARLVIDSGLHTKGWSRQQAVDYMLANTAWPRVDIENDVNRYISWPGQANSYMLGMLEIRRLRTAAEAALGARFDLRAFHSRILENGAVPLPMLDQTVTAWIGQQASGGTGNAQVK